MTIVCKSPFGHIEDICSGKIIPRKVRFYVTDSKGYYYIPEVSKELKYPVIDGFDGEKAIVEYINSDEGKQQLKKLLHLTKVERETFFMSASHL